MKDDFASRLFPYTEREELANRWTHIPAVVVFLAGAGLLIVRAAETGDPYRIVSASIFAVCLSSFYVISSIYHSLKQPRLHYLFRALDHAGIFLVIAGTYTPFTLVTLRGAWGWSLFGVVWGAAIAGLVYKSLVPHRHKIVMPLLYLALGWVAVVALKPLRAAMVPEGIFWLFAGGLSYSVGLIFYAAGRIPY
ncbi:MAG TPA: hemolysin III family protein, partial [Geothermobacteraceae bacterium]|nr:hemolysin III family protein [Geothermobacteraceae bacterium]